MQDDQITQQPSWDVDARRAEGLPSSDPNLSPRLPTKLRWFHSFHTSSVLRSFSSLSSTQVLFGFFTPLSSRRTVLHSGGGGGVGGVVVGQTVDLSVKRPDGGMEF